MHEDKKQQTIPKYVTYINSSLSGCGATAVLHPIDVVKNRMQISGEGGAARAHKTSFHAVRNILKNEGPTSFYNGFSANIARQLSYTTLRLGTYQVGIVEFQEREVTGFQAQLYSSLISGFLASLVATPTDVALVRMTSDNHLPASERRNYKNVIDAIIRLYKEEGFKGLWAGATPTVLRAMAGNVTQIVSYVQTKHYLIDNDYMKDGSLCHTISSAVSGLVYAFLTVPLDVAKTRLQKMKIINGKPEYRGIMHVYTELWAKEGIQGFWKGFGPYYVKIGPNTILLFLINEKLTSAYKKYVLDDPSATGGF